MSAADGVLQVVAEAVVATQVTPDGKALTYHYRNALLFPGVGTPKERAHFLRRGMVKPFAGAAARPAVAADVTDEGDGAESPAGGEVENPAGGDGADEEQNAETPGDGETGNPAVDAVPFDDPERVKARAKLPADGLPDGRAAQAVWVEAAVAAGYLFNAVRAEEKAALVELLNRQKSS